MSVCLTLYNALRYMVVRVLTRLRTCNFVYTAVRTSRYGSRDMLAQNYTYLIVHILTHISRATPYPSSSSSTRPSSMISSKYTMLLLAQRRKYSVCSAINAHNRDCARAERKPLRARARLYDYYWCAVLVVHSPCSKTLLPLRRRYTSGEVDVSTWTHFFRIGRKVSQRKSCAYALSGILSFSVFSCCACVNLF